jgi:hypothetical protein
MTMLKGRAAYGTKRAADCERQVQSTPGAFVDPHEDFPVKGRFGQTGDDYEEVCEVDPNTGKVSKYKQRGSTPVNN